MTLDVAGAGACMAHEDSTWMLMNCHAHHPYVAGKLSAGELIGSQMHA